MMPVLCVRALSRGRGAVEQAAYCGRRRLYDRARRRTFDFSHRPGLAWSELTLPDTLPADLSDPERLWNAVDGVGARHVREVLIGLPRGRPLPAHAGLARGFLEEAFAARGRAVDWHIHYDRAHNLHVHALVAPPWLPGLSGRPPAGRIGRTALHALWRRHCERQGLTGHPEARGRGAAALGGAHALWRRGVVTRRWQALAALRALRPPGDRRPAWLRLRRRRREREARDRARRADLARGR